MKHIQKLRWEEYLLMGLIFYPAIDILMGYLLEPIYAPHPYDPQLHDLPVILFFSALAPKIYRWFQSKLVSIKNPVLNKIISANLTFFGSTMILAFIAMELRKFLD